MEGLENTRFETPNCNRCGGYKPDIQRGLDFYHQKCWDSMRPNEVFPREFRRDTNEALLDREVEKQVKDGKLIL